MNYKGSLVYCDDSLPLKVNKRNLMNVERAGYYVRFDEVPDDNMFLKTVCHSLILRYWAVQRDSQVPQRDMRRKIEEV